MSKQRPLHSKSFAAFVAWSLVLPLCGVALAQPPGPAPAPLQLWDFMLAAKARPDECYAGPGQPPGAPPCAEGADKANDAYVWSMTATDGGPLWLGTSANVLCQVLGGYLQMATPIETDDFACQFALGPYGGRWPASLGDWRPPHIYTYEKRTSQLTDQTAKVPVDITTNTLGWRGAGCHDGLVFFAGLGRLSPLPPGFLQLTESPGFLQMVVFDAATENYVAGRTLPPYTTAREFCNASDGNLYVGVGRADVIPGGAIPSGRILKWINNPLDPRYPLQFEEVGLVHAAVDNITEYQGRLWVTTQPLHLPGQPVKPSGLYRSPVLRPGGLNSTDLNAWEQVWDYGQYDKDPINSAITFGGALRGNGDWLYFGTMHIPLLQAAVGQAQGSADIVDLVVKGHRATSIFRLRETPSAPGDVDPPVEVQLLWGRSDLPVFNPATLSYGDNTAPTGYTPLYGDWGMENLFNNYCWSMENAGGWLYVGTMDWSYVAESIVERSLKELVPEGTAQKAKAASACAPCAKESAKGIQELLDQAKRSGAPSGAARQSASGPAAGVVGPGGQPIPSIPSGLASLAPGFDLWAARSDAWLPVTLTGFDNIWNYGARTLADDGGELFLGSANPMNIHPYGGWELWRGSQQTSTGLLNADRRIYHCSDSMYLAVRDNDLNTSLVATDLAVVTAWSSAGLSLETETVALVETSPDSGFFVGWLGLDSAPSPSNDGVLQVFDDSSVIVEYSDAQDATGQPAAIRLERSIDCAPPAISNVRLNQFLGYAVVTFETDEVTAAMLQFGANCDDLTSDILSGYYSGNATYDLDAREHVMIFPAPFPGGPGPFPPFYYSITVMDYAGNLTYGDNAGQCYSLQAEEACESGNAFFTPPLVRPGLCPLAYVENCDLNTSAVLAEQIEMLAFATTPDGEVLTTTTMTLFETGPDTGVFMGQVCLASPPTPRSSGVPEPGPSIPSPLIVEDGNYVRMSYYSDGVTTPTNALALVDSAGPVISHVEVTNIGPTQATIQFSTDELSSGSTDYGTTCTLRNLYAAESYPGVSHVIQLIGLAPDTAYAFDVAAMDMASNTTYDDNAGACYTFTTLPLPNCSDALISLDRLAYRCDDRAAITVTDCGENHDPGTSETIHASISSGAEPPPGEDVILTETDVNTGVFAGAIDLQSAGGPGGGIPGDGILQVNDGDAVEAAFHDPDDGSGQPKDVTATARVDCAGPLTTVVQLIHVAPNSAEILVVTNELANVTLDYGLGCHVWTNSAAGAGLDWVHDFQLTGLTPDTLYKFAVTATDQLGNGAVDDNGGACHEFRTPAEGCNEGALWFDHPTYPCDAVTTLTLADCGENRRPWTADTVLVLVSSDSEPAGETIILTETGPSTGVFVGHPALSGIPPVNGDSIVSVKHRDTVQAAYLDADHGLGLPQMVYANAMAWCPIAPRILSDPQSQTVNPNATVVFDVVATGTTPLSYQWRKGLADLPGETLPSLTLPAVQESDEGQYSCVVGNDGGTAESKAATLSVNDPPRILVDPVSRTVDPGTLVEFSVVATGTQPLLYQWRKNNGDMSGRTSETLTLDNVQESDEGFYACVVSNMVTSVQSTSATLTVNHPDIQVTPASLDFLGRDIDEGPTAIRSVRIDNLGTYDLHFVGAGIALTGPDKDEFAIVNSPPTTPLAPGAFRMVDLQFDPATVGPKIATLSVATDDFDEPAISVGLRGEGQQFPGPPILTSVTEVAVPQNAESWARMTWTNPNLPPDMFYAIVYDLYESDWVTWPNNGTIWAPFLPTETSGTLQLPNTGGYFAWISNLYPDGSWFPCLNPWAGIIYSGTPHTAHDAYVESLGGAQVLLHWRPEIYGTWFWQIIVYKVGEGWIPVQGPDWYGLWHFIDYGEMTYYPGGNTSFFTGQAEFTLPSAGTYWFYIQPRAWLWPEFWTGEGALADITIGP